MKADSSWVEAVGEYLKAYDAAKNFSVEQVRPDSRTAGHVPRQLWSDDLPNKEHSTKRKIQERSHRACGFVETWTGADA